MINLLWQLLLTAAAPFTLRNILRFFIRLEIALAGLYTVLAAAFFLIVGTFSFRGFLGGLLLVLLLGILPVGALVLKLAGVPQARLKWVGLLVLVALAGLLLGGIRLIGNTSQWNALLATGVGVLILIHGWGFLSEKPGFHKLAAIGWMFIVIAFLGGLLQWRTDLAKKHEPAPTKFCWSKPADVRGAVIEMREACFPVQVRQWNAAAIEFEVVFRKDNREERSVFYLHHTDQNGVWENTGTLRGQGVWEEQPSSSLPGVRLFGRLKDVTEDNRWVNFWVTNA